MYTGERMDSSKLASILNKAYMAAKKANNGTVAVSIHLFGIEYADYIHSCGTSPKELAILAGVPETYGTEINKGLKLSEFVQLK